MVGREVGDTEKPGRENQFWVSEQELAVVWLLIILCYPNKHGTWDAIQLVVSEDSAWLFGCMDSDREL